MRLFLFVIAVFNLSYLYSGEGKTACGFLKFSESAKEASLSGSYSSYNGGAEMIFSNPAGLADAKDGEVYLGFSNYLGGSKLGLLSFKTSKSDVALAFGVINFLIDSIEKRLNDAVGIVPSAGSFSARDTGFIISASKKEFAKSLIDNLSAGLSIKVLNSKIDNQTGYAFALDAGFLYRYQPELNFSLVFSNFGTPIKYKEETDKLPSSIKFSGLYQVSNAFIFTSEIEHYLYDEKFYPSLGIEWQVKRSFALRTGYRFGYDTSNLGGIVGLGVGFGITTDEVGINYAYIPFGELGDIHKFDLSIRF